jgi:PAS domain S-box-containing protein
MNNKRITLQPNILKENFESIVDLIRNYAIYTLDTEGHITSWNEGAKNINGWNEDEVLGKSFEILYLPEDRKKEKPKRNLKLAKQNKFFEEEDYRVKKNGEKFLADITIAPIHDKKTNKHIGFINVVKDITQRKQRETDQIDANTLLKTEIESRKKIENALTLSNEELDAFASAASHDLQEPLRMVVSYLQLIERRYIHKLDQDGREFLEFAVDGAKRMRTLISDLVEYSRIDTFGKPFILTDATEALRRAIENLEVTIKETHAQITYDTLPNVVSDDVQLTILFQNLLANAIKFRGKEEPQILVGIRENPKEYVFSVSDNGRGIDEKNFETIFVIFKQIGKRSERTGSGVGLAIAKKIVSRHNGKMWLESTPDKGSTFYFSLPKKNSKEENI